MIRARMVRIGKRPIVLLGLSAMNVRKLQEGKPIHFDGREVGIDDAEFVIMYGETEQAMASDLGIAGVVPVESGWRQELNPLTGKLERKRTGGE